VATRTVVVHDRCTTPECGRVLHSLSEAERGQCSSCWMKTIPADTRKSLNKLIASAFKPTTEAEKGAAVDDAMAKLKRDRGEV
jgi:hypothetical protein